MIDDLGKVRLVLGIAVATLVLLQGADAQALAVPNAGLTFYDVTSPTTGFLTAPSRVRTGSANITYTGASDAAGSGIQIVEFWVKQGSAGTWSPSGMQSLTSSGTFVFVAPADGTYYFSIRLQDYAGNISPIPSGAGLAATVFDSIPPVLTLLGLSSITMEVGGTFTDPGASATDNIDGNITSRISRSGSVNTAAKGTYTLTYTVSDLAGNVAIQTRSIRIVDTTVPVISLKGNSTVEVSTGAPYTDAGATARDNYDGDITARIAVFGLPIRTNKPKTVTVTYNVSDTSGNAAVTVTRTVRVLADATIPVITLQGTNPVSVAVGNGYTDAGATATDNVDGNITSRIVVTGLPVKTSVVGTYTVAYNVTDSAGNAADAVSRTVSVVDTTKPVLTLSGSGTASVFVGGTYSDAGATATDNYDGDITARITASGLPINTTQTGTYAITYSVSDSSGNAASPVTRTVQVVMPALNIAWPIEGSVWYVSGVQYVPMQVNVTCEQQLDNLQISLDDEVIGTANSVPSIISGALNATYGPHTVTATGNIAGTSTSVSKTFNLTIAEPDATADADNNGLPDNPFTQLTKLGDAWITVEGTSVAGAVNLAGFTQEQFSQTFIDATGFAAEVAVPQALSSGGDQKILLFAMSDSLRTLFNSAANGFQPEPEGYIPISGNRYMAATVISSADGGQTFSEADAAQMASNPIHVTASLSADPTKELFVAAHTLVTGSSDSGITLTAASSTWGDASYATKSISGSTFVFDLGAPAVVAIYERNENPIQDTFAPTVAVTTADGQLAINSPFEICGTASDANGTVGDLSAVYFWGDENSDCQYVSGPQAEWKFQVPVSSLGMHTYRIQAIDATGNLSEMVSINIQYGAIGDVNMDGLIQADDATLIGRLAVMGESQLNTDLAANGERPAMAVLADINLDGVIDSLDATLLRRALRIGLDETNQYLASRGMLLIHLWEPVGQQ